MALNEQFRGFSILHALFHRVTTDPEDLFLLARSRRLVFEEVGGRVARLVASLSNLGIESGDCVAIVLP